MAYHAFLFTWIYFCLFAHVFWFYMNSCIVLCYTPFTDWANNTQRAMTSFKMAKLLLFLIQDDVIHLKECHYTTDYFYI